MRLVWAGTQRTAYIKEMTHTRTPTHTHTHTHTHAQTHTHGPGHGRLPMYGSMHAACTGISRHSDGGKVCVCMNVRGCIACDCVSGRRMSPCTSARRNGAR